MNNRLYKEVSFRLISQISFLFCALLFVALLLTIIYKGWGAISFSFLFTPSSHFGAEGGILFQILGSIILCFFATLFSLPLAIASAIWFTQYAKKKWVKEAFTLSIFGLNGIPSIIYGLFGLILLVNLLNIGISWIIGSIILSFMMLPTIIVTSITAINQIETEYKESSLALGHSTWMMVTKVIIPQSIQGSLTGLFLALARAVGETAPIMFIATVFSGATFPRSFFEPVATLPTHILVLAGQATNEKALQNSWGAALVLLLLVTLFSLMGLIFRIKKRVKI